MRHIQYAINESDGLVISRVDSEVAWPALEYDKIGEGGDYTQPFDYHLVRFPVYAVSGREWRYLRWTKKVPVAIKNLHRAFWGFPPLQSTEGP